LSRAPGGVKASPGKIRCAYIKNLPPRACGIFSIVIAVLLEQCFVVKWMRQSTAGDISAVKKANNSSFYFREVEVHLDHEIKTIT